MRHPAHCPGVVESVGGQSPLALAQQTDLSVASSSKIALADAARRDADLRLYTTTDRYEEPIYLQQTYAEEGDNCAGLMSHHHS